MTKLNRLLTILMATSGIAAIATPAQAVNSSFAFSGTCLDCGANTSAIGLLTLSDYTLGDALSVGNFVSFTFSSANYPILTFDSINAIAGAITGDGGNNVSFIGTAGGDPYFFGTSTGLGAWTLVNYFPQDIGLNASWTQVAVAPSVPEPAAWALMILGFGVAGATLRRRNIPVVAA